MTARREAGWVVEVSEPKSTALAVGRFITIELEASTDRGTPVGKTRTRGLYFRSGSGGQGRRRRELIVSAALASNDHELVHLDQHVAQGQALPDISASIVTTAGLVLRFVGERTPPQTRCHRLALGLARPAISGDVLDMTGYFDPQTIRRVSGTHHRGQHAEATVELT